MQDNLLLRAWARLASRHTPFFDHAAVEQPYTAYYEEAKQRLSGKYWGHVQATHNFLGNQKWGISHTSLFPYPDETAASDITLSLHTWASALEEYYISNWPNPLSDKAKKGMRGRCAPRIMKRGPVVTRATQYDKPSARLVIQIRFLQNLVVQALWRGEVG